MQIDELPSYTILAAATNHPELLDRASWRRFHVRIELPMPSAKELAEYIQAFMARFGEPSGMRAQAIAKSLGKISYAEAEQFCLDVRRRQILGMGREPLRTIVAEQLKIWMSKVRVKRSSGKVTKNAGASAPSASRA